MLKTMTKSACALAAALTFTGTVAHADNYEVDIDQGAYSPVISYVGRGDNLIFTNYTDNVHVLNGPDESWTSGPIEPGARYILNINNKMALTFSGDGSSGEVIEGRFTYEPAPEEG